jgi:cell division inhibitor SulA
MGREATTSPALADLLARRDIWRGRQTTRGSTGETGHPSGWQALDELLGGGWPREGLTELYSGRIARPPVRRPLERLDDAPLTHYRDWSRASLGFGLMEVLLPLLGRLTREQGAALVNPPARPCAERWQRGGVALDALLLVRPRSPRELGWAVEEILRSGVYPLVIAWLPPIGFALRRRLKLAAEQGGSCLLTPYPMTTDAQASPARRQLGIRRTQADELVVRRLKPFDPREIRLTFPAAPEAPGNVARSRPETPCVTRPFEGTSAGRDRPVRLSGPDGCT